jgi:cobalt-zinc-cadmium efflux system membrane fusion protein
VRAEVENPDYLLKPEMFANFTIYSSDEARAPAIPEDAIIYEGAEARVWMAGADHRLSSRQIKIGRTRDRMVEVLSGLNLGESVVAGGAIFIDRAVRSDISPAFSWDRHA